MTTELCPNSNTRSAACACGTCCGPGGASAADKFTANRRDALALARFIVDAIEHHPALVESADEKRHWGHVGDLADLRTKLGRIVVGLCGGESEDAAWRDVEEALCHPDGAVQGELVERLAVAA